MKRVSYTLTPWLTCLALLLAVARALAALPDGLSYQGYLTDTGGTPLGLPTATAVNITFRLYNDSIGGPVQWSETQSVMVDKGLFTVQLGSQSNPLPEILFDNPVWLGIEVNGDGEMSPRKAMTSVGFAYRAKRAEVDADTLAELDCAVNEVAKSGGSSTWACAPDDTGSSDWSSLTNVPAGFADDVDDDSLANLACPDTQVLKADNGGWICAEDISSGNTDWSSLTGVPAGFADGVDNVGTGDITQVNAGTGLSGGGSSGDVTLNVGLPFLLSYSGTGSTMSITHTSSSRTAIEGTNSGAQTIGKLGSDFGVYGEHLVNGNYGRMGTPWEGLYASSPGGRGVRGVSTSSTGVMGNSTSEHGGYFSSAGTSIGGSAVYADNTAAHGIAIWGQNAGTDTTLGLRNAGTGDLIRGFNSAGIGVFQVMNDGTLATPVLIITGGSDLSENFNITDVSGARDDLNGLVVSIDPEQPGALRLSDSAYDTRVAGIVSGAGEVQPGLVMGQRNSIANGDIPVALTGRVYCRADASNGAIQPGDLLTTSDMPGYAMKVTDHARAHGAILGKAMSGLETGQGLVLVLVSLH